jgi:hypothetical protein
VASQGLHPFLKVLGLAKNQGGFLQKHGSLLCGDKAFAEAAEQGHLEFLLQLPDHAGQAGLGNVQLLGGPGSSVLCGAPEEKGRSGPGDSGKRGGWRVDVFHYGMLPRGSASVTFRGIGTGSGFRCQTGFYDFSIRQIPYQSL